MEITLEHSRKLTYNPKTGAFRHDNTSTYYLFDSCKTCGELYWGLKNSSGFCNIACTNKGINHNFYGKKRPKEFALKMSMIVSSRGPEIGEKIRQKKIGKKRPDMMGNNNPAKRPGVGEKISNAISGENHYNWKGGISCEPYCVQWTDKEYKNYLKYERDGGKCQNPQCNGKSHRLVLHHINYIKKDCRPINLITLCNSCNTKANTNREWHGSYYNEIMRRR